MGKKRVKITEDNLSWGITALAVICLSIAFYLIMTQMPSLKKHIGTVLNVLMPVIIGIIIAYLLLPVYNSIYRMLMPRLKKKMGEYYADGLSTAIAVTVSIVLMLTVVLGLAVLALPQIIQSIISIAYTIPPNLAKLSDQIVQLLKDNPTLLQAAEDLLQTAETNLNFIIRENVIPYFTGALGSITMGLINVAGFFVDLIIGLIVCVYILISKETFSAQAKKLVYSGLPAGTANHLLSDTRRVHRIFGGFISGSIIDSLIIVSNNQLLQVIGRIPFVEAFKEADNVLRQGVQTITDLIAVPAMINLDFADVRSVMEGQGSALIGIGISQGDNKAQEAAQKAIQSPLLEAQINGAKKAIVNVTGGANISIYDANDAVEYIREAAGNDIDIIFGVAINEKIGESIIVTVIATGFDLPKIKVPSPSKPPIKVANKIAEEIKKETEEEEDDSGIPSFFQSRK